LEAILWQYYQYNEGIVWPATTVSINNLPTLPPSLMEVEEERKGRGEKEGGERGREGRERI
jgi:hypothetical protein